MICIMKEFFLLETRGTQVAACAAEKQTAEAVGHAGLDIGTESAQSALLPE